MENFFQWRPLGPIELISMIGSASVFIWAVIKLRDVLRDLTKAVRYLNDLAVRQAAKLEVLERLTHEHSIVIGNLELAIAEGDNLPVFDRRHHERRRLRRILQEDKHEN